MVITIESSSKVFPSELTPNGTLQLSESDQIKAWTHITIFYIFKSVFKVSNTSNSIVYDPLKKSLTEILVPYYPLVGRLRKIAGNRLELDCCAAGAVFIEAYCDAKLEDFGDFKPSNAVRQLIPKVDPNIPIEDLPVLQVQATRFSCGGLSLGFAMSHILVDGIATNQFLDAWASIARGEKTKDTIFKPYHDRKYLKPKIPLDQPLFDHQEYKTRPLLIGRSDTKEERENETEVAMLKLSKEQVKILKNRANEDQVNQSSIRPYSTYESLAGHLWVCACKARIGIPKLPKSNDNRDFKFQPTMIRVAVDLRRRLSSPPLPEGYAGNATVAAITPTCTFGDIITKPLSYAAGKIREGTTKITDEYARSALNYLASKEDMSWIKTSDASFWGNPNLSLGTWLSIPIYEIDFGWGSPYYAGPAVLNSDGKTFIMPSRLRDGSVNIAIRLQTRHMGDFKKFFYQDLESFSRL